MEPGKVTKSIFNFQENALNELKRKTKRRMKGSQMVRDLNEPENGGILMIEKS